MWRPRTDFLIATHRRQNRLWLAVFVSAALTGGLTAVAAAAASASPPPPPTTPSTTGTSPTTGTTTSSGTTTTTSGTTTTTPKCKFSQLSLKYIDTQGAAGNRFVDYAFENVGKADCTLRGYPRIVLLNKSGKAIKHSYAKVKHDPVSPFRVVTIKPGKRAYFTFGWAAGTACPGHSFTFYSLRAYPPHDVYGFVRHPGKTSPCGDSARVTRVRPKLRKF